MTNDHTQGINDPYQWLNYVPHTLGKQSPLYGSLYSHLEQDPDLLALLALVRKDQPIPVLFLTCVNFLLLREPQDPLAVFYPTLHADPRPAAEAYPAFRAFCLRHEAELRALLPGARLQTNEVTRCANLLPAFEVVFQRGGRHPLALWEIGSSAGLNLLWNRYHYRYDGASAGDPTSPVHIQCTLAGTHRPPLPVVLPEIAQIVGIELAPLDLARTEDVRWLQACIWPEETRRYQLLDSAIALAKETPPRILPGDAAEVLPPLLADVPQEQTLCLWHSFALRQGPMAVRERIEQLLWEESRRRTIFRISLEALPERGGLPRLELFTYQRGELCQYEWLAECAFHGEHMEWLRPTI